MRGKCIPIIVAIILFSGACVQPAAGKLVAYYPLDEGRGTSAQDASGYGNKGTIRGNPMRVAGKEGGALKFDGDGDYIDCGNGPSFQIRNQVTIAFWLKTPGFGSAYWAALVTKGDFSWRMSRSAAPGNSIHMGVTGTSAPTPAFNATKPVTDNEWHHVAGVYDGSYARIYIDGAQDASLATTGQLAQTNNKVFIGENESAPGRYLVGTLDEVRIYDNALTPAEIRALAGTTSPRVTFADPKLETAVKEALGISAQGTVTEADMMDLGTLNADDKGITSLAGLEYAKDLTELHVSGNQIEDASPLKNLTALTWLYIGNNEIEDISPLAGLVHLTFLNTRNNPLADISAVAGMKALEEFWSHYCRIRDISPLSGLTKLKRVGLYDNAIADIGSLRSLSNLEYINLGQNQISDISPLGSLKGLTGLELELNRLTDLSPLKNLPALTTLYLWSNQITDISPLAGLTKLTDLELYSNEIGDLSALSNLVNLTYLDVCDNHIPGIQALTNARNLTKLYLDGNRIADTSPLAGLTKLTNLWLDNNLITDVSPLAKLTKLTELWIYGNRIANISALAGLSSMETLVLSYNHVVDITPLASLANLKLLELAGNQIRDIAPLAGIAAHLQSLILNFNPVENISLVGRPEFHNLQSIGLGGIPMDDYSFLHNYRQLSRLYIYSVGLRDISFLAGLPSLTRLELYDNQISDISILSSFTDLERLRLDDNQIADISALTGHTKLVELNLKGNPLNEEAYSAHLPVIRRNNPLDYPEYQARDGVWLPGGLSYDPHIMFDKVVPAYHGSSADVTLTIAGEGFTPQVVIELVSGSSAAYGADHVEYISPTRAEATFKAGALPAGVYSIRGSQGQQQATLPDAFEVRAGGRSAHLTTSLELPDVLGYQKSATIWVDYTNDGEITMPAPLLYLTITQNNKQAALLTLDGTLAAQGLATTTLPEGFSHSIQILADGSSPGRLYPGESGRIPVYWAGWLKPWDTTYPPVSVNLGVLTADEDTPIDYGQMKQAMRPTDMDASAWDAIWANFMAQTGATWGAYVQMLDDNATYLDRINRDVADVGELLAFEFMQADTVYLLPYLSSSTDAAVTAPGLDIALSRAFLPAITSRWHTGSLGCGWYHNWDIRLTASNNGPVTIKGPFGSHRVFQPQAGGGYSSEAGDHGRLSKATTGGYELTESNGVHYAFSAAGQLNAVTDTNGNRVTTTYINGRLSMLTHSSGQWLQLAYNAAGRITSVMESTGRRTTYTYDAANEHLLSVTLADGSVVRYAYNTSSTPALRHALESIEYPGGIHHHFTYDAQGRLTATNKEAHAEPLTFAYDSAGMIAVTDAYNNTTRYFLDHKGLIRKTVDPLEHATYFDYDENDNPTELTDTAGNSYTYRYDPQGNLTQWTDPRGHATQFEYDKTLNQMTGLMDAAFHWTHYAYDAKGNLSSITYPDGTGESWTYDAHGNATAWTNRRSARTTYGYDAAGQMTSKFYPVSGQVAYTYDARGNLTSYNDAGGRTTLTYDAQDRLKRITYPQNRYLEYSYDAAGRRATCTDQLGHILTYAYDAVGRLDHVTDAGAGAIVSYEYDDAGRLARKTLGNGVYTTYAYDAASQILHLVNHKTDDTVLSRFDYEYDNLGRRVSMTTLQGTWWYEYDALGQLTAWTDPAGRHVEYVYDALGNRETVVYDGVSTDYTTNNMNQYTQVGDAVYTYDVDGNMRSKTDAAGTTTYECDAENRLIRVVTPSGATWKYTYDGLGNRVAVIENGTSTQYVHDPVGLVDVVGEYAPNGDLAACYVHGYGLAARIAGSGDTGFYSFDALGSTSEITDLSGQIINSYVYDPFGETSLSTEAVPNAFRFVGEYGVMHEGNGLDFMRARYYNPDIGRFISEDPLKLGGGDISFMRYALNNPLSFVDPVGEMPEALEEALELLYALALDFLHPFVTTMTATEWQDWVPGSYTQQIMNEQMNRRTPLYRPSGADYGPLGRRRERPIPTESENLPLPPGDPFTVFMDPVPITETEPEPEDYTLTVRSIPESGVAISGGTYGGTTTYTKAVPKGTTVTLTAPAYVGEGETRRDFCGWTGSVNNSSRTISFSMDSDKTVTAEYGYILTFRGWGVTISSSTGHGGTVPYSLTVPAGTTVTLTAPDTLLFPPGIACNPGYPFLSPFSHWWALLNGDTRETILGTETTITFVVNQDMILGAAYPHPCD